MVVVVVVGMVMVAMAAIVVVVVIVVTIVDVMIIVVVVVVAALVTSATVFVVMRFDIQWLSLTLAYHDFFNHVHTKVNDPDTKVITLKTTFTSLGDFPFVSNPTVPNLCSGVGRHIHYGIA